MTYRTLLLYEIKKRQADEGFAVIIRSSAFNAYNAYNITNLLTGLISQEFVTHVSITYFVTIVSTLNAL